MKILITDPLEQEVVEALKSLGEVIYQPSDHTDALREANVLIVRSATHVTRDMIERAPQLKIVARAGVGLDNIDVTTCIKKNIKVLNTPGASANAVAELTIASMFNLLRHIPKAHLLMKNKKWAKKELKGEELDGKTVGIIGFGRIGSLVAEKAHALGCHVLAYDPRPRETGIARFVSLGELLAKSDIVTLHTALTPETQNMVNEETIEKMKDGAYLINIARGELIDEDALYDACKNGKLAGAALDVYPREPYTGKLLDLDNIYFTPHLGASTRESQLRVGEELIEKLKKELG